MSFQAYLDNIQAKTGQSPDDLRNWAASQGFTEAGQIGRASCRERVYTSV